MFLTDGRVAIDNNPAERALRPIGIGRKNWLFAGADTGVARQPPCPRATTILAGFQAAEVGVSFNVSG